MNGSSYLYFSFAEVDPPSEFLADEGVGIVSSFEDPLQGDELLAVESSSVAAWFQAALGRLFTVAIVARASAAGQFCKFQTIFSQWFEEKQWIN